MRQELEKKTASLRSIARSKKRFPLHFASPSAVGSVHMPMLMLIVKHVKSGLRPCFEQDTGWIYPGELYYCQRESSRTRNN